MRRAVVFPLFFFLAGAASAIPLSLVSVEASALKCKFDKDCQPLVGDRTGSFSLPGAAGQASLLSRTWPAGKAETAAAGLRAYLYRFDLSGLVGGERPCISRLRLDFGPVGPVDYDGDGKPDEVFVITSGGPGSVGPSAASRTGDQITFDFDTPVCAGESSFFFGLASAQPARAVYSEIAHTPGGVLSLEVQAPELLGGGFFRLGLPQKLMLGRPAALQVSGARPGAVIELYKGQRSGSAPVRDCPGLAVEIGKPDLASRVVAGADGKAVLEVSIPFRLAGNVFYLQAVEHPGCRVSRLISAKVNP